MNSKDVDQNSSELNIEVNRNVTSPVRRGIGWHGGRCNNSGSWCDQSQRCSCAARSVPESPDTSVRWNTQPGDLYSEKRGYGDEDVTGWKGRYIYGPTVGIIQLPANIPMLPGDVGNPTTFDFPVLYELIEEIDPFWVLAAEPHPVVMEKVIAACKRLTMQGVRSIIGNCGFFANYQPEVAKSLDPGVQFFNGFPDAGSDAPDQRWSRQEGWRHDRQQETSGTLSSSKEQWRFGRGHETSRDLRERRRRADELDHGRNGSIQPQGPGERTG